MTTKIADSKGRISLGSRFANQTVIVEEVDAMEVRVILAQVVPQREMWLSKNSAAKTSIARGLAQAQAGQFAPPPELTDDAKLVEQLND
jgi:predicted transcriptional regulator